MRSRKLLALLFCLITFPAIAGYMTLLGAGVGSIAPVAQGNFVQASYALNKASLDSVATFSRAGNAMQFDSSGYLTYGPNNLLIYAADLTNAAWTKALATITAGVSDPVGGTAAFTYTATGNGSISQSSAGVSLSGQRKFINSTWLRRRTGTGLVRFYNANATPTSVTLTSSWQQFFTVNAGNANNNAYFQIDITAPGDAIDVYAPVMAAVTYETTPRAQDQVITTSAAYYGPRIDYDPNTLAVKGLLIEEARTNIVLQNRDLTNAAWTKGATATVAKDQIGIDGVANSASSFTGGAVSATNTVLQSITLASSTRAQSAWVKRLVGSGVVNMTTDGGATWNAITLTGSYTLVQFSQAAVTNPSVGFQITTLNDKIAVDVVQNEPGTFATSSIITAAASVTRAADVVQFTGPALTALQGASGSAIFQTVSINGSAPAAITNIVRGTNSILYRDTTNKTGTTNGTNVLLTAATPTWNTAVRNGVAWSAAGRSLAFTGGAVATDANVASNVGTLYLGSNNGSAVENAWYTSFAIYNQRLPDATLQTKVVIGAPYAANDNGIRYAFADNDNLPIHWRVAL